MMVDYTFTNIVPKKSLRKVQLNTLEILASVLSKTAGPRGSNTQLLHGNRHDEYTKDGHNVLSEIKFYRPLENAIQTEMKEVTRYIVKTVGDGTTSAVLLSNEIFKAMCEAETSMSAYTIMSKFKEIVNEMIKRIRANKRECTLEDIYDICMIATNGNKDVATSIRNIYKQFGMEVFIDVGISNTTDHLVKSYDGLTLEVGYPTPAYINTSGTEQESGRASIRNPRIYAFEDPVDTPEMMAFLDAILEHNIFNPMIGTGQYIPTVILAPSISRDANKLLTELERTLYGFDQTNSTEQKPPVLIITNANINHEQYSDILMLCGIPTIRKYIDPTIQQKDIDNGDAPTPENVHEWYGSADLVEADTINTKFVNPKCMFDIDEEGNRTYSSVYNGLLNYITQELDVAYKNNEDANVTGKLKRRLNSLKTNLVEYLIGGITVTDRDSIRDLVEDAVLNCRSAAKNGVGYGANFEAFRVIHEMMDEYDDNPLKHLDGKLAIKTAIRSAYWSALIDLYMTVYDSIDMADAMVHESLEKGMPLNLATMEFDGKVLCSIETDVAILEAISKVIMVMFTANQALLESPMNNVYLTDKEN